MGCIHIMELASGAVAGEEKVFLSQFFKIPVIDGASQALGLGLEVPVKAQPAQVLPEQLGVFRFGAQGIQILHPQDPVAAPALGAEPA